MKRMRTRKPMSIAGNTQTYLEKSPSLPPSHPQSIHPPPRLPAAGGFRLGGDGRCFAFGATADWIRIGLAGLQMQSYAFAPSEVLAILIRLMTAVTIRFQPQSLIIIIAI